MKTAQPRHLVWDWNGTLLNDAEIVLRAANHASVEFDAVNPAPPPGARFAPLTVLEYQRLFVRPIQRFYSAVLGREITEANFRSIEALFHAKYLALLTECGLTLGAREALMSWRANSGTQSLLSLWGHEELLRYVKRFGVAEYFDRIDGRLVPEMTTKSQPLRDHLAALGPPESVVLIGDSLDDADAAADVGIRCVMYAGGSHEVERLELTGNPVAHTLTEAILLAAE